MSSKSFKLGALLASIALAGCAAQPPTNGATLAALRESYPTHAIFDAKVSSCQEGRQDDAAVQVCDVCFLAVGVAYGEDYLERGGDLQVRRVTGSLTFRKAISAQQPDVAPSLFEQGVWVASGAPENLDHTAAHTLPDSLARRLGYERQGGLGALMSGIANTSHTSHELGSGMGSTVVANIQGNNLVQANIRNSIRGC